MALTRILYVSRRAIYGDARSIIERIIEASQRNNARDSVGGILCVGPDCFLQLCEGEDKAVAALFERIRNDERHQNLQILDHCSIHRPLTNRWVSVQASADRQGQPISYDRLREMRLKQIYRLLAELYSRVASDEEESDADDALML